MEPQSIEEKLRKSEARLANAQRIAKLGNWEWDIVNNELHWSDEIYRIFGLSPQAFDATYEAFLHSVHPADREFVRKSVNDALYGKKLYNIDHRIVLPDGSVRIVHEQAEIYYNETGTAVQMNGIVQDITDREQKDDLLRKLSQAVEQSICSVVITDTCGNIQYVNPKFTQITGYSQKEAIGKTPRILKTGKTSKDEYKHLWDTITNGGSWQGEFYNKKKNGECYWELAQITPMKDREGNIINFLAFKEDITEIKRKEEEQKNLRDQLYHIQKIESIGRLAGGIAHDFNNFLMAIIGYANLSQFELKEDDPVRGYLNNILNTAERASALTRSILTFSRKQPINTQPESLNNIVKKSEILSKRLIGEDIKYTLTLSEKNPVILCDSGQIEQVIMNLVLNAKDAMPDGGTLTISTDVKEINDDYIAHHGFGKKGKHAVISVSDTGIGMDTETKEKIFEPFFTTKNIGKGTGLGLAIIYGIVQQHDGFIDVHSEQGNGATFDIYFPLINIVAKESVFDTNVFVAPTRITKTILIAEDDTSVRFLLKETMQKFGYKVIAATDGKDAIDKFTQNMNEIDLLILDMKMPEKNGKKAYDEIKKMNPDIKAIFLSGYSEEAIDLQKMQKEGLSFIQKPVLPTKLIKKIRDILVN